MNLALTGFDALAYIVKFKKLSPSPRSPRLNEMANESLTESLVDGIEHKTLVEFTNSALNIL